MGFVAVDLTEVSSLTELEDGNTCRTFILQEQVKIYFIL